MLAAVLLAAEQRERYCIYCRRKVREAQVELGEWVEGG